MGYEEFTSLELLLRHVNNMKQEFDTMDSTIEHLDLFGYGTLCKKVQSTLELLMKNVRNEADDLTADLNALVPKNLYPNQEEEDE